MFWLSCPLTIPQTIKKQKLTLKHINEDFLKNIMILIAIIKSNECHLQLKFMMIIELQLYSYSVMANKLKIHLNDVGRWSFSKFLIVLRIFSFFTLSLINYFMTIFLICFLNFLN